MPYTTAFYEDHWFAYAITWADQASANSNYYDMEEFHRATAILMTGTVAAAEDARIAIYAATDGAGTGATVVKQMTAAQAVNGNDDLAIIEIQSEEVVAALANGKFIQIRATVTGTPEYGVMLVLHDPRFQPVDVTHLDRLIS